MPERLSKQSVHPNRPFVTTQWSVVVAAAKGPASESQAALASLCENYWYPLYAYVRRRGHQPAEAQDLTQAFFAELLEKKRLRLADQHRGKFRSFLLASLNHFMANQWREARALKRGGGKTVISLDFGIAESRYAHEPAHELTPEKIFERRWAMTVLDGAVNKLRDEYEHTGKLALFEQLKEYLGGAQETTPYKTLAKQLQMTEGAVKVAVHRLRKRCRELVRQEITETVTGPNEVDEELKTLFTVFEP